MKTLTLIFASLLLVSNTVFSKGGPPNIYAMHNSESVLFYNGGSYFINQEIANYTDTLTLEMLAGDTCKISTSGTAGYPVISFRIYRNDTLIHDKPSGSIYYAFQPGKYRVVSTNTFTMYPTTGITFYVRRQATSITEDASPLKPLLYPNPCTHTFSIQAGSQDMNGSLLVVDMNGKQVWNESSFNLPAGSQHNISTGNWQAGIYFLQVFSGSETQRFRIVKN